MNLIADVVIVGAGVLGCSTAFHLTRFGRTRVIVVEKGSLASGMTKRSGALIRTYFANEPEAQLALKSLRYFQNWRGMVGGSCGFTQTGLAVVMGKEDSTSKLQKKVEMLQSIGVNTQIVSPDELRELQPNARVDDVAMAAYEPEAGFADPVATAQAFATRAKEKGVVFKTGTLVKSIRVGGQRVTGVNTTVGEIEAPVVVVMAGPWSDQLLKPLGVEIGIQSERAQITFFDRPPELKAGHSAFLDYITGAYFRPHTFGLTLGGLIAQETEPPTNPDHFDEAVSPEFVSDVQKRMTARLPAMANAKFLRGHAGVYDSSPDARPILGQVPRITGLVVAAGFSGKGFTMAPAVGAGISELITDGAAHSVDLTPFRFTRPQENQAQRI